MSRRGRTNRSMGYLIAANYRNESNHLNAPTPGVEGFMTHQSQARSESLDLLLLDVSAYGHMPPLGLIYIASYTNSMGFAAKVHLLQGEYRGYSKTYLKRLLEQYRVCNKVGCLGWLSGGDNQAVTQ